MKFRAPGGADRRLTKLNAPFHLEVREINTDDGTFSGWASTTMVDSYGTVVAAGAYADSLAEHARNGTMPALLYQHDWEKVLGRILKLEPRERDGIQGLWMEGKIELRTQLGKEVNALIQPDPHPAINGLSIGFEPDWDETDYRDGVLIFNKVKIWEVSVCTFQANPGATIEDGLRPDGVKTERDLERLLRDAGHSRSEASAISSRFKPKTEPAPREAAGATDLRAAMEAMRAIFS